MAAAADLPGSCALVLDAAVAIFARAVQFSLLALHPSLLAVVEPRRSRWFRTLPWPVLELSYLLSQLWWPGDIGRRVDEVVQFAVVVRSVVAAAVSVVDDDQFATMIDHVAAAAAAVFADTVAVVTFVASVVGADVLAVVVAYTAGTAAVATFVAAVVGVGVLAVAVAHLAVIL